MKSCARRRKLLFWNSFSLICFPSKNCKRMWKNEKQCLCFVEMFGRMIAASGSILPIWQKENLWREDAVWENLPNENLLTLVCSVTSSGKSVIVVPRRDHRGKWEKFSLLIFPCVFSKWIKNNNNNNKYFLIIY